MRPPECPLRAVSAIHLLCFAVTCGSRRRRSIGCSCLTIEEKAAIVAGTRFVLPSLPRPSCFGVLFAHVNLLAMLLLASMLCMVAVCRHPQACITWLSTLLRMMVQIELWAAVRTISAVSAQARSFASTSSGQGGLRE